MNTTVSWRVAVAALVFGVVALLLGATAIALYVTQGPGGAARRPGHVTVRLVDGEAVLRAEVTGKGRGPGSTVAGAVAHLVGSLERLRARTKRRTRRAAVRAGAGQLFESDAWCLPAVLHVTVSGSTHEPKGTVEIPEHTRLVLRYADEEVRSVWKGGEGSGEWVGRTVSSRLEVRRARWVRPPRLALAEARLEGVVVEEGPLSCEAFARLDLARVRCAPSAALRVASASPEASVQLEQCALGGGLWAVLERGRLGVRASRVGPEGLDARGLGSGVEVAGVRVEAGGDLTLRGHAAECCGWSVRANTLAGGSLKVLFPPSEVASGRLDMLHVTENRCHGGDLEVSGAYPRLRAGSVVVERNTLGPGAALRVFPGPLSGGGYCPVGLDLLRVQDNLLGRGGRLVVGVPALAGELSVQVLRNAAPGPEACLQLARHVPDTTRSPSGSKLRAALRPWLANGNVFALTSLPVMQTQSNPLVSAPAP